MLAIDVSETPVPKLNKSVSVAESSVFFVFQSDVCKTSCVRCWENRGLGVFYQLLGTILAIIGEISVDSFCLTLYQYNVLVWQLCGAGLRVCEFMG
jgi:hypothetical protein